RLFTAVDTLKALNQELNIAYSARIKLDIQRRARRGECAPVHFLTRHQGRLDGREVHVVSVDMGLNTDDESSSQLGVSSGVSNLDKSLPLPVLGSFSVVRQGISQAHGQLSLGSFRTQPQIDAKHWPLWGHARQGVRDA